MSKAEEIAARREVVLALYIEGGTVWAIAKVTGYARSTVQRDLDALRDTQDVDGARREHRERETEIHGGDYLLTLITTQVGSEARSVHDTTCRKVIRKAG